MPELGPLVCPLAFAYGAVGAGAGVAFLLRAARRTDGRAASTREVACCALIPAAALVLIPLISALENDQAGPFAALHLVWHRLEALIHGTPAAHAVLHAGNWLLLLLVAICASRAVYAAAQMHSFARSLRRSDSKKGPFVLIPSNRALCFSLGLWDPVIYVTSGLRQRVSDRDFAAVLAHEAAHVRRRDGVLNGFLTLFFTLFPVPRSGLLLSDWQCAVERECDADAARHIGSSCDVAAALVRVARVVSQTQVPAGLCFARGKEDIEGRVIALLSTPGGESSDGDRRLATPLVGAVGLGLLLAAGLWLHHIVAVFAHH